MEGDRAIVGMDGACSGGIGAAYVFSRNGTNWVQEGKLVPNDPLLGDLRVRSVSIDGDYAAVDAFSLIPDYGVGGVHVFHFDGVEWVQKTKLEPGFDVDVVSSGQVVSIHVPYVAFGERYSSAAASEGGAVFLYEFLGEPDCNNNDIRDACDLDCDGNGTPEDCDPFVDCNQNGEQDSCDIFYQSRPDCDNNGVPDECQIDGESAAPGGPFYCTSDCDPDCNTNGTPDACDTDCNSNSSPDDCDIAEGSSEDCNSNGIPDECDMYEDCNGNGVNDECDIAQSTSADCNYDVIPDECQPDEDCNDNGFRDICDIALRISGDCHHNLVPDECEIAEGTSTDADGNGIPDECECTGPMFALVPVNASGDHWISTEDNEIFVTGGQQVFLHIEGCAWDPDLDGSTRIKTWQAIIDSGGYQTSRGDPLSPWNPECSSDEECEALMGYDWVSCDDHNYPLGGCAPGFQDFNVDPGCASYGDHCLRLDLPAVSLAAPNFAYGSTSLFSFGAEDDGLPHYAGTVALEVPADAVGTFTVPLIPTLPTSPYGSFMKNMMNNAFIPLVAVRPARITVAQGCCLPNDVCTAHDPQTCLDLGGRPVGPPCEGDCDGNGVPDACEHFADCNTNGLPDACDIENNRSDDSNFNGVPDECESGACCGCPPDSGCDDTSFAACTEIGGHFAAGQACASVTCPTVSPSNDECIDAIAITDGVHPIDTRCATTDGPVTTTADCNFDPPDAFENDIWYEYVATCSYRTYIAVTGADYDAYVAVYCDGSASCSCPTHSSAEYACGYVDGEGSSLDIPVTAGNCYRIRVGGLHGAEGTGMLEVACYEVMCYWANDPAPEPTVPDEGYGTRNRYLSFQVNDPDRVQAIRVRAVDLPAPFEALEGQTYWVSEPLVVTEVSSLVDDTPPTMNVARLRCEPHFMDWTAVGPVHAFGPEVVPGATYEIQAIDSSCYIAPTMCSAGYASLLSEELYSVPLTILTSRWGDVTSDCGVWPLCVPLGDVSFLDIAAVVDKFRNRPDAPSKSRTDLAEDTPNLRIDFVDIAYVVEAFRGSAYPFSGPVACD